MQTTRDLSSAVDDVLLIEQLLDQLSADQREVIELRHLNDLTIEETAAATGRPLGTVKTLQRRGILQMRVLAAALAVVILAIVAALLSGGPGPSQQPIDSTPGPTPSPTLARDLPITEGDDRTGDLGDSGDGDVGVPAPASPVTSPGSAGPGTTGVSPEQPGAAPSASPARPVPGQGDQTSTSALSDQPTSTIGTSSIPPTETVEQPAPPQTITSTTLSGSRLVGSGSGLCLSASGTSYAVTQESCDGTGRQLWVVQTRGDGFSAIVNASSGLCLDVYYGGYDNGTQVGQYTCHDGDAQAWQTQGGGLMSLMNVRSGRCLDLPGNSMAAGTTLIIWDCHGDPNQLWRLA